MGDTVKDAASKVEMRSSRQSGDFRVSHFIRENFVFLEDEEANSQEENDNDVEESETGGNLEGGDCEPGSCEKDEVGRGANSRVSVKRISEDVVQKTDEEAQDGELETELDSVRKNTPKSLEPSTVAMPMQGTIRNESDQNQADSEVANPPPVNGYREFPLRQKSFSPNCSPKRDPHYRHSMPVPFRSPIRKSSALVRNDQERNHGNANSGESDSSAGNSPCHRRLGRVRRSESPASQGRRSESPGSGTESVRSHGSEDSDDDDDAGIYAESFRYSSYKFVGDSSDADLDDVWLPTSKSDTWIHRESGYDSTPRRKDPDTDPEKTDSCTDKKCLDPENPCAKCSKGGVTVSHCGASSIFCCKTGLAHKNCETPKCCHGNEVAKFDCLKEGSALNCGSSEGSEVLGCPSVPSTASTSTVSMSDLDVSRDSGLYMEQSSADIVRQDDGDAVFSMTPPQQRHPRSDSVSTTLSEQEFRDSRSKYLAQRTKVVRRYESTSSITYTRISQRLQDVEIIRLERERKDSTFGFHIIGSEVTTVERGSVAHRSGVKAGSTLITVNDVDVSNASHEEVQKLILTDPMHVKLGIAAGRSCQSASVTPCCGFLTKQGGSGLLKNWRRRWFELKEDNCLYYYKTENEKDPLGAILLANYTVTRAPEVSRKHTFKLVNYPQRTYYLQACSEEDMNRWAHDIATAADAANKKNVTWLDVSSHNVGLPALSIKQPDCHGYLTKMGNRIRSWKRRYCVLKDACLYYYVDVTSSTAQGVAHLHGYTVVDTMSQYKKLGFQLQPPEKHMRTFCFTADNETDKKRWIESFRTSIAKWVKADE